MEAVFEYIRSEERLKSICKTISEEDVFGIDIECENNLHHYGAFITLMQISTRKDNYILDVLAVEDIAPLLNLLESPKINKIFHDISYDLRMLNSQFKCRPKNIFDTEIAAQLLGMKEIGLKSLLDKFFEVKKQKKFQKADWTLRPLTQEMLSYAIKDSIYLIQLKEKFQKMAKKKKREDWLIEEMSLLENLDLRYDPPSFETFPRSRFITDQQRAILKRLFDVRENIAKNVNRPVHFIITNKRLLEIVEKSPHEYDFWENLRGVHPKVRALARKFYEAEKKGMDERITRPKIERKKYSSTQIKIVEMLEKQRTFVAEKHEIASHLIISKAQIREIAVNGHTESLRNWQKKLLKIE